MGGYSDWAGPRLVRNARGEPGRCPLTSSKRYTEARSDNFDFYLPSWLAQRNKMIFGTLFAIGELFALGRWMFSWQ